MKARQRDATVLLNGFKSGHDTLGCICAGLGGGGMLLQGIAAVNVTNSNFSGNRGDKFL